MRRKLILCSASRWVWAVIFAALCGTIDAAHAATYFVAPTGLDTNPGTTQATAFKTIQRAVRELKAGDTVLVKAGRYPAFQLTNVNGTASAPITFKPFGDGKVTVDRHLGGGNGFRAIEITGGGYSTIDGFEVTDSDPLIDTHKNCDLINNFQACVAIAKLHGFGPRNGIKLNTSSSGRAHHLILQNLTVHHNASQGILSNSARGVIGARGAQGNRVAQRREAKPDQARRASTGA
jgi:hypothetical protein